MVLFRGYVDRGDACVGDRCARAFVWTSDTGTTAEVSIPPKDGPSRYSVSEAVWSSDGLFVAFTVIDRRPCSACEVIYIRDLDGARSVRVS